MSGAVITQQTTPERSRELPTTIYTGADKYGTYLVIGMWKSVMPSGPDAAEVAHRLKAYPALVEALRKVVPFIDDADDVHTLFPDSAASSECRAAVAAVRALLRDLGEAS